MAKTKIIGHRGAAGLALENTLPSFQKAVEVGVQVFEFDVRTTKDNYFVVSHDDHLARVSDSNARISELTYEELQRIELKNGARVPLLKDVLELARRHRRAVIVEIKTRQETEALCELLDQYQDLDMTIASFKRDVIVLIRRLRPTYKLYFTESHRPVEVLYKAKKLGLQGIDLNYKLLNPLTYLLAKRWKLEIMVYTINSLFMKRIISALYPNVAICTDHPERFLRVGRRSRHSLDLTEKS